MPSQYHCPVLHEYTTHRDRTRNGLCGSSVLLAFCHCRKDAAGSLGIRRLDAQRIDFAKYIGAFNEDVLYFWGFNPYLHQLLSTFCTSTLEIVKNCSLPCRLSSRQNRSKVACKQCIDTRMLLCRYNGTLHVNIRAPHDMSEFGELQPHPFMPVLRYNLSSSIARIQRANRYKKQD